MPRPRVDNIVVSCEHGGNTVPAGYGALFKGQGRVLRSHRGFDPGALELSRRIATALDAPLFYCTVTRLLVDTNRSPGNPARFSEFSSVLSRDEKAEAMKLFYEPFREALEAKALSLIRKGKSVIHVSVHSFTPVLNGRERKADIGLLYDPSRSDETGFCRLVKMKLAAADPGLRVRMNYPYKGVSDGFTRYLRRRLRGDEYLGIELEVNQMHALGARGRWVRFMEVVTSSLDAALRGRAVGRCSG